MKHIKRLLICVLIIISIFALASCDDKPQAKLLTDLQLPALKDNQAAVIIKNGDKDYVSYTVDLTKFGETDVTAEAVLTYLETEAGLTIDWTDSAFGKFINAIGGINPDASKNEYVTVLTTNAAFQGTWAGVTEYELGEGVSLKDAAVGVTELLVAAGDVVYFELASY